MTEFGSSIDTGELLGGPGVVISSSSVSWRITLSQKNIYVLHILSAVLVTTLANLEGEETFEPSYLGQAEEVVQDRICDDELILIKG